MTSSAGKASVAAAVCSSFSLCASRACFSSSLCTAGACLAPHSPPRPPVSDASLFTSGACSGPCSSPRGSAHGGSVFSTGSGAGACHLCPGKGIYGIFSAFGFGIAFGGKHPGKYSLYPVPDTTKEPRLFFRGSRSCGLLRLRWGLSFFFSRRTASFCFSDGFCVFVGPIPLSPLAGFFEAASVRPHILGAQTLSMLGKLLLNGV